MPTRRYRREFQVLASALLVLGVLAVASVLAAPDGTNIATEAGPPPPEDATATVDDDRQNIGDDADGNNHEERSGDGIVVVDVDGNGNGAPDGGDNASTSSSAGSTTAADESTTATESGPESTTSPSDSETTTIEPAQGSTTSRSDSETTTTSATSGSGMAGGQPSGPVRAAFFYPWFPNAWRQGGIDPFTNFSPSLGRYSSSDPATIRRQIELADRAHIDAFIASWWGQGHHTDQALPALLDTTVTMGSPGQSMKWAVYYEPEGYGDPSASELVADLRYLSGRYFGHSAYLRVDGKPVVFVWAESSDGAGMVRRWADARSQLGGQVFVVLKVFSGFKDYASQADSWHQYGPAKSYSEHLPYSATVSPGFWLAGQSPRLARSVSRFENDVATMNASGAFWQLVTSWNEWGEGTSVEPADEFGNAYLDALAKHPPAK